MLEKKALLGSGRKELAAVLIDERGPTPVTVIKISYTIYTTTRGRTMGRKY